MPRGGGSRGGGGGGSLGEAGDTAGGRTVAQELAATTQLNQPDAHTHTLFLTKKHAHTCSSD